MKDFTTSHQASSKASIISANYVKHHGLNIAVVLHSKGFESSSEMNSTTTANALFITFAACPTLQSPFMESERKILGNKGYFGRKGTATNRAGAKL